MSFREKTYHVYQYAISHSSFSCSLTVGHPDGIVALNNRKCPLTAFQMYLHVTPVDLQSNNQESSLSWVNSTSGAPHAPVCIHATVIRLIHDHAYTDLDVDLQE